jgi:hypothetical protein
MTEDEKRKEDVCKFSDKLRTAGVARVSVSYSGCGDEGRAEEPQLEDAEAKPMAESELPDEVDIHSLADLLEGFVPEGYEDGEGGFGTVSFDVGTQKIRVEHNWYETVSHAEEPREI